MRKTKIICTLGPASSSEDVIRQLILAGMNVARFNFSHGSHSEHMERFNILSKVRAELGKPIATLLDTKGPEVRLRSFEGGKAQLETGKNIILTTRDVLGTNEIVSVSFQNLPSDVYPGCKILLDDGLIELKVISINDNDINCLIVNGGQISDNKGVNIPGVRLSMPYVSEKDREDILFGVKTGFDFIAASFTRCAEDILEVRKILNEVSGSHVKIIAKIENAEGVENIDDILKVTDGVMIARGDMGVEIPFQEVPILQKMLIKKAYNCGKQVITATQMLESMIKNPRPTRAEATDVANAIYDGTSAIMLSGETAAGSYPVEAVRIMAKIAERTEADIDYCKRFSKREYSYQTDVTNAISHATCTTAYDLNAAAIMPITKSGLTARMVSKYRPDIPIIACATDEYTCRQLNLSWGVTPFVLPEMNNTDELFNKAVDTALKAGLVKNGDLVVITAGMPLGISGTTNLLKVHVVGNILVRGTGVNKLSTVAPIYVASSEEDALKNFSRGNILVIKQTTNNLLPIMKQAAGIITELDGLSSPAAILGMALEIPVIVGANNATKILKTGTAVCIDAASGLVSNTNADK